MVAKITSGKNIRGIIQYNESKVMEATAECLYAHRLTVQENDTAQLKYQCFNAWMGDAQRRIKTNAIHISLNFDTSEQLNKETLSAIAESYMNKIGFGSQPFLVYQHFDAAHPHIHIVSTNINENGKRIDIHNIGRTKSEKARKEIEIEFKLEKADSKKVSNRQDLKPFSIDRVVYGKAETKRGITNIVRNIVSSYKFTSLSELNAVLRLYNVVADPGHEGTKMFERKGLVYSVLNSNGEKIGVPIKASSIYGKPTLSNIEKKFQLNAILREPHQERIKTVVDAVLNEYAKLDKEQFSRLLYHNGINVIYRNSHHGQTYGVTYVDHISKVVFNGSDLGKAYSAKGILQRLSTPDETSAHRSLPFEFVIHPRQSFEKDFINHVQEDSEKPALNPLANLLNAEVNHSNPNQQFKNKKRKNKGLRM